MSKREAIHPHEERCGLRDPGSGYRRSFRLLKGGQRIPSLRYRNVACPGAQASEGRLTIIGWGASHRTRHGLGHKADAKQGSNHRRRQDSKSTINAELLQSLKYPQQK